MGFFQGMARAVGEISQENFARKEKEKDRELSRERDEKQFERQKELAEMQARLQLKNQVSLAGIKSRRSSGSGSTKSITGNMAQLEAIGIDQSIISKVAGEIKSAEGLGRFSSMIMDSYEAAVEAGPVAVRQWKQNINQQIKDTLVIHPSKDVEFTIDGLEDTFVRTEEGGLGVDLSGVRQAPPATPGDVDKVMDFIADQAETKAEVEKTKISSAINRVEGMMNRYRPKSDEYEQAEDMLKILYARQELVSKALQTFTEEGDAEGLFTVYGTPIIDQTLEEFSGDKQYRRSMLRGEYNKDYGEPMGWDFTGLTEERMQNANKGLIKLGLK